MGLKVKFWGVRGLLPVAPTPTSIVKDFRNIFYQFFSQGYSHLKDVDLFLGQQKLTAIGGYGTCTTCVEINSSRAQIIIDAGSGIKRLGDHLMKDGFAARGKGVYHIFLTHFHSDHLIGLPFFTPIFIPGNEIHFYAAQDNLEKAIRYLFSRPYFPVDYGNLPSKISFHQLKPQEPLAIHDIKVTPFLLDHVDPCWGYRIDKDEKSYTHCSDTDGQRFTNTNLSAENHLFKNVDLMYYDTQAFLSKVDGMESPPKRHSTSCMGLDLAMQMGVKRILFGNHHPDATTATLQNLEKEIQAYYISKLERAHSQQQTIHPVQWSFVYEELTIEL